MHTVFAISPSAWFAIGVGVALAILLALEIYNSRRVTKLTYPVYEYAIKRAEEEANRIVEQGQKEARQLIAQAESASLQLAQSRKSDEEQAKQAYEKAIQTLLDRLESELAGSIRTAQDASARMTAAFVEQLQKEGEDSRAHLAQLLLSLEEENKKRIDEQLTAVFDSARTEAQQYAQARKAAIDAQGLALIGEAVKITLGTALLPETQVALIERALEEAKANHVF